MTERYGEHSEARGLDPAFPETVDDDYPERGSYPEPDEPALPADREQGYRGAAAFGTTVQEQIEGESLDQRLAQEEPEEFVDPLAERDVDEDDEGDPAGLGYGDAGQLVAPDEGAHPDLEKDEIAREVAASYDESPEELAMHIEPERG